MTRYILILLINVIGIFGPNTNCCAKQLVHISQYDPHDKTGGELKATQISTVSFAIIEGNNSLANHLAAGNRLRYYDNYSLDRHVKTEFTSGNINLLTLIRKDIHFLSVLLI